MNMNNCCSGGCSCCGPWLYTAFRVIVGGLFLWHGVGKLMNWSSLPSAWMQTAGVIETLAGALILLGLYTSIAAIAGAVVMIGAWALVHAKAGNFNPMTNGGELPLLFFASFLVLHKHGDGKFALGNLFGCNCECSGSCEMEAPVAASKPAKKKSRK